VTTPLDVALRCLTRGWPVFPVRTNKHPLIKWGTGASTGVKTVTQWWQRWPQALVGVPTGRRSGIIVLDIDVKGGRNGFDTLAALGLSSLPVTPIAHTRSTGVHVYFACIAVEIRNSEGEHGLGVGLDVRGEGGFVVVPTPDSGYRWDPECNFNTVPLMPAPAWLGHKQKEQRPGVAPRSRDKFDPRSVLADCSDHIRNAYDSKYRTVRREAFIAGTLVRDRFITERHARHELEAALTIMGQRVHDYGHMLKAYEGAFAEGLAASRRSRR